MASTAHAPAGVEDVTTNAPRPVGAAVVGAVGYNVGGKVGAAVGAVGCAVGAADGAAVGVVGAAEVTSAAQMVNPPRKTEPSENLQGVHERALACA